MKKRILFSLAIIGSLAIILNLSGVLKLFSIPSTSNEPNLPLNSHFFGSNLIKPDRMDFAYFKFSDSVYGYTIINRLIALPNDKLECKEGVFFVNDVNIDENLNLRYAYGISKTDAELLRTSVYNDDEFYSNVYPRKDTIIAFLNEDYVNTFGMGISRYFNNDFENISEDISSKTQNWDANNFGPIILPENKYFFLGDNRDNSLDSRYRGFVDEENIIGTLLFQF